MKDKIIMYYREIMNIKKKVHPTILASSLTYFFVIVAIPFLSLVNIALEYLKINTFYIKSEINSSLTGFSLIFFIVSLIYVSSKFIYALKLNTSVIYNEKIQHSLIWERIKSFIIMLLMFLFILIEIIGELYIFYFLQYIINIEGILIDFFQLIARFLVISIFFAMIMKQIIPIKIKFSRILLPCTFLTFISYFVIRGYYIFYNIFGTIKAESIYGGLYQLVLFFVLIYILFTCFIYVIIFEYVRYKTSISE